MPRYRLVKAVSFESCLRCCSGNEQPSSCRSRSRGSSSVLVLMPLRLLLRVLRMGCPVCRCRLIGDDIANFCSCISLLQCSSMVGMAW